MTESTLAPLLLTVPDVMARLRLSRNTVYRLIRTRQLHSVTIGRARRIPIDALTSYLHQLTRDQA